VREVCDASLVLHPRPQWAPSSMGSAARYAGRGAVHACVCAPGTHRVTPLAGLQLLELVGALVVQEGEAVVTPHLRRSKERKAVGVVMRWVASTAPLIAAHDEAQLATNTLLQHSSVPFHTAGLQLPPTAATSNHLYHCHSRKPQPQPNEKPHATRHPL